MLMLQNNQWMLISFFLKDKRNDFKATHPDLKSTEIVKSLNKQWIELDITE
ncbi:hypothetical protein SHM_20620 [Spiroplasma ixodetis]|uniref:HMG box domain-containing protein n=1 Tax=Spiroplasma ixodetis TaxID=2141 RepID=A0ABN6T374_9MOLU|nr:hypothetical protein SHM_20620 [Spiroplasma ixodetis]